MNEVIWNIHIVHLPNLQQQKLLWTKTHRKRISETSNNLIWTNLLIFSVTLNLLFIYLNVCFITFLLFWLILVHFLHYFFPLSFFLKLTFKPKIFLRFLNSTDASRTPNRTRWAASTRTRCTTSGWRPGPSGAKVPPRRRSRFAPNNTVSSSLS